MTPISLENEIRLHDPVYGPVVLDEPLLIDLYRSAAFVESLCEWE